MISNEVDQCNNNVLLLNDDCFYHIYNFLPIRDWCSLRFTCTRLRTISDYCFQRQTETFELKPINVSGSWSDLLSVTEVKQCIRSFGQFITKLSINRNHLDDFDDSGKLILFLNRYCTELRELKLVKIDLDVDTIGRCERLFRRLSRLVVDQWIDEAALNSCLAHCISLKELELIRLHNFGGNGLVDQRFKYLESFAISCCSDFDYPSVLQFLISNPQLTKVKFLSPAFPTTLEIMDALAVALPNLMELSVKSKIHSFQPNMAPVAKMHALKKIEVDCLLVTDGMVIELLSGLAGLNNLEFLHLTSFRLTDDTIRRLCTFKNLSTLAFTSTSHLDSETCKKLAIELPALSELRVVQCEYTTFHEINEFVVHLTNLKRIVFVCYYQDDDDDNDGPLLTADVFLSLFGARNSKSNKEVLSIFLKDNDLHEIHNHFKRTGVYNILEEHSNVLKLLPLEEEQRRSLYEYGVRYKPRRHLYDDVVGSDGDLDHDDFNDSFGDVDYDDSFGEDVDDFYP